MSALKSIVPTETIENCIFVIRDEKVMFDRDLARLYGVTTSALNQAVKRNLKRFPEDFMFRLTPEELINWRSQIVISNSWANKGLRRPPNVFTEHGIAMLSSVLNSERAIMVNIQIIRTFTKLREMIVSNEEMKMKLDLLERRYDEQFSIIFDALRRMMVESEEQKPLIGFNID